MDEAQQLKELMHICREMRQAQKDYFARRKSAALEKAKKLESELDKRVKDYYNPQINLL